MDDAKSIYFGRVLINEIVNEQQNIIKDKRTVHDIRRALQSFLSRHVIDRKDCYYIDYADMGFVIENKRLDYNCDSYSQFYREIIDVFRDIDREFTLEHRIALGDYLWVNRGQKNVFNYVFS